MEAKISAGGDLKNKDLHPVHFDRGGNRPYYTRPMAAGLPDRVDCAHLAEDAAVLERVYALRDLPRLQDLLADSEGSLRARFAFAKVGPDTAGATVTVHAVPRLVCQRCMQGFAFPADASSEIEFAGGAESPAHGSEREVYRIVQGLVSLRDLAEEELLLALPIAASCTAPERCGNANCGFTEPGSEVPDEMRRPFSGLQDLLKKRLD